MEPLPDRILQNLQNGLVIPACPLALTSERRWDERRQRALIRYYRAAGAGGLAVGVHTTQFAIRRPGIDLFRPLLALAREELDRSDAAQSEPALRVGGVCGLTKQAIAEACLLRELGYHAGLLSLAGLDMTSEDQLLDHCRQVAAQIPLFGFYLQPSVGGRILPYTFWHRFAEIPEVVAIKIAPFNRYQTLEVIRAVAETGRDDIALYTGNDDQIILDLLTSYRFRVGDRTVERRMVGGLLGHWAFWTQQAVALLQQCHHYTQTGEPVPQTLFQRAAEVTDANAAVFDAANRFAGCIPGVHEILRRQGFLEGTECLDPHEILSPGQREEINRVYQAYPHLNDDAFVRANLDEWLS